jgi:hypothetical protein
MPNFSQMSDLQLVGWMNNFISVAGADPEKYGVTTAQVADVTAVRDDLQAKISARTSAEDAAKAAVAAQKASRAATEPKLSYLNTTVKANPNVSDADKQAIGIEPNKPPTFNPPVRPENLVVNGYQDGRNVLHWNRVGNKPSTQFIIEYKVEGSENFAYLDTTTETKYTQTGATVGKRCTYRVKAKRSGEESTYSNEAVVY